MPPGRAKRVLSRRYLRCGDDLHRCKCLRRRGQSSRGAACRQHGLSPRGTGTRRRGCPTLVLPECAAAIARRTGNPDLARQLVLLIEQYPRLQLVALTLPLAQRAAQSAAMHQLRGADAVYVAVAGAVGARLITWDVEMLNRGAAVVSTATPTMWLEESVAGP